MRHQKWGPSGKQALDLGWLWLGLSQPSTPGFKPQQLLPFLVTGTSGGLRDTHCGIAPAFDRKGKLSLSESVELAPGKTLKITTQLERGRAVSASGRIPNNNGLRLEIVTCQVSFVLQIPMEIEADSVSNHFLLFLQKIIF